VLYFAQGAQFAASHTLGAARSTPKETYQWIIELVEAGHFEVTFYLEMSLLYVLCTTRQRPIGMRRRLTLARLPRTSTTSLRRAPRV